MTPCPHASPGPATAPGLIRCGLGNFGGTPHRAVCRRCPRVPTPPARPLGPGTPCPSCRLLSDPSPVPHAAATQAPTPAPRTSDIATHA